jgi:hypothetical protein
MMAGRLMGPQLVLLAPPLAVAPPAAQASMVQRTLPLEQEQLLQPSADLNGVPSL